MGAVAHNEYSHNDFIRFELLDRQRRGKSPNDRGWGPRRDVRSGGIAYKARESRFRTLALPGLLRLPCSFSGRSAAAAVFGTEIRGVGTYARHTATKPSSGEFFSVWYPPIEEEINAGSI